MTIVGTIQEIAQNSGGYLLTLTTGVEFRGPAIPVATTVQVLVSTTLLNQFALQGFQHPLDKGTDFLKGIKVQVESDESKTGGKMPGYKVASFIGFPVGYGSDSADRHTAEQATGGAAKWPSPNKTSPFTPIPVPFLSLLGANSPRTVTSGEIDAGGQGFRIGYAIIPVDCQHFSHQRSSYIRQATGLRMKDSIKTTVGAGYESYNITYTVDGPYEICAGVRDVFEQISLTPFVSAEGGPFGEKGVKGVIPYKDMAVRSYGLSTIPGMPGSLQVQIDFDPFIWDWWRPHTEGEADWAPEQGGTPQKGFEIRNLDDAVCYPLYKIWCKSVGRSQYNFQSSTLPSEQVDDTSRALSGKLVITIPSAQALSQIEAVLSSQSIPSDGTDKDIARSAAGLIAHEYGDVVSDNVKEIVVGTGDRYIAIKINDPRNFLELTGLLPDPTADGGMSYGHTPDDSYVGLIEWARISAFKYADAEGNRTPKGSIIQANQIPLVNSSILGRSDMPGGMVDITPTSDFPTALQSWLIAREQRADTSLSSGLASKNADALYASYLNHPEQYFAVLVRVTEANKGAVETKLASLANRSNLLYSAGSKSFNDQIFQVFDQPGAIDGKPVLAVHGANEDKDIEPDIIIQQISGLRSHSLSVTSVLGMTLPVHSYLGSMGAVFTIQGHCFGLKAKRLLEQLKEEFDNRAIKKTSPEYDASRPANELDIAKRKAGTPFFRVENEIFQLMGCNFAMPVTLTFDSVDGMPDDYQFTMTMIDYDPRINNAERIKYLPTINQLTSTILAYGFPTNTTAGDGGPNDNPGYHIHPTVVKARDFFSLQAALRYERLFPDLELPTKNELNRWIESCTRIAKRRLADDKPAVTLDADDLRIESIIDQFLSNPLTSSFAVKLIAAWDTAPGPLDGGLYVDPDFYYFYHSEDDFGNMLDTWTKKILGKPTDTLSAGEREEGGAAPTRRMFDTEHDVVSVTPTDFIGATTATAPNHVETVIDNTFEAHNGQKAVEKLAAEEKVKQERLTLGQSLGWWVGGSGLEDLAQGQKAVLLDENFFNPAVKGGRKIIPQEEDASQGLDIAKVSPEYQSFFELEWRSQQLKRFAEAGWARPSSIYYQQVTFTEGNFLIPVGDQPHLPDWQGPSEPSEMGLFNNLAWLKRYYYRTDSSTRLNTIDTWADYIYDHLTTRQNTFTQWFKDANPDLNEISLVTEKEVTTMSLKDRPGQHSDVLVNQPSYMERVYMANQSYSYWLRTRTAPTPQLPAGGTMVERQKSIYATIDYIAAQYNIDPHLVRAYFQVRSGLGNNPTVDNVVDAGWGEFDLESTGLKVGDNYTIFIDKFCQVYQKYARKFNGITSFSLYATDAELTSKGREVKSNGVLTFEKSLQTSVASIGNPKALESASVIQKTLKELPLGTDLMCLYYTAWVEIARIFGPIVNSTIGGDCFFSADNPLLILDIGKGFKPSVFGDNLSMETTFAPCAKGTLIRASRGITGENKLVNLSKENPQISAEARATMLGRNRVAISPASEDSIYGMLHDFRKYAPHGRLIGAFPAYLILFINEGFYWQGGGQKLWDQYYTRTAITAIEVFKSKNNPGDVATVTLSNVFHQLTRYAAHEALLQDLALREKKVFQQRVEGLFNNPGAAKTFGELWSEFVLKNPSEQLKKIWQQNFLNVLVVGAGARLHIRMGYGSDASKLPIVFNGTVVEAPVDEGTVTILAVGDGAELEKPSVNKLYKSANGYAYVDQGLMGTGKSPSNIVTEALINLEGFPAMMAKATGGSYGRDWSHGITHFGDVYLDVLVHHPAEIQINLYDSALTSFEQGVPAIKNYFIAHALYDWRGENTWFSVDVSEPTPWKVIEVCRHAVADFVASAEPIMTQSTVFFGRWWWPFNYAFAPSILDVGKYSPSVSKIISPPRKPGEKTAVLRKPIPKTNPLDRLGFDDWTLSPLTRAFAKYDVLSMDIVGNTGSLPVPILQSLGGRTDDHYPALTKIFYVVELQEKSSGDLYTGYFYIWGNTGAPGSPNGLPKDAIVIIPSKDQVTAQSIYLDLQGRREENFPALELIATDQNSGNNVLKTGFDTLKDVNFLVSHMLWKPYMQIYMAHSHLNLLSVNIKADSTNVYTDAIGLHTYHGFFTGDAVERNASWCVDDSIQPTERKTVMVNTGILLTAFEAGLPGLKRKVAGWLPGLSDFVNEVPPTPAIGNGVLSVLVDSVKEMYQGWFTIIGTPSMKPRDLVLFSDIKSGLSGPVWVKECIHRLDGQVGFITMVSPDCVAVPHSSLQGYRMLATMTTNVGFQFMAWWATRQVMQATKLAFGRYADKNFDGERMYYRAIRDHLEEYQSLTRSGFKDTLYTDIDNFRKLLQQESSPAGSISVPREGFDPQDFHSTLNSKLSAIQRDYETEKISKKEALKQFKELVSQASEQFPRLTMDAATFDNLERLSVSTSEEEKFLEEAEQLRKTVRKKIVADLFEVDEAGEVVRNEAGHAIIRNKFTIDDPQKLEQVVNDLEHDEWIKFLKKNKKIVDSIGLNAVNTEDLVRKLTSLEAVTKDVEKLKGIRAMKALLSKQKLVLTIEDFQDLHKILHTPFSEYFELTLKDRTVLQQLMDASSTYRKILSSPINGIGNLVGNLVGKGRDGETVAKDFTSLTKLKSVLSNVGGAMKKLRRGKEGFDEVKDSIKVAAMAGRIEQTIKDGVMAARVASYAGPQAILSLVKDVVFFCVGDSIVDSLNHHLKARHSVKIIPLHSGTIPYVAGIRGHQGAVIGDDPGWLDNILMEWVGGKNEPGHTSNFAKNATMFMAGFVGIQVPDWTQSPAEQKYLRSLQENNQVESYYPN